MAESCKVQYSIDNGVFGAPGFKCYKEFTEKLYFPRSLWKLKLKGYPTNRILNLLSKVVFAVCYRLYYFDSLKVVKFVRKTVPGKTMEYLQKRLRKLVMYQGDIWRECSRVKLRPYNCTKLYNALYSSSEDILWGRVYITNGGHMNIELIWHR